MASPTCQSALYPVPASAAPSPRRHLSTEELIVVHQVEQTLGIVIQTAALSVRDMSDRRASLLIRRAGLSLRVRAYAEATPGVPRIVGRFDARNLTEPDGAPRRY